jgi:D-sedoheptulose 7-phosphate isomerase
MNRAASDRTVEQNFAEHLEVMQWFARPSRPAPIAHVGYECAAPLAKGGTLFWFSNGGSAADSQHLAAEFVGRFKGNRRPLRAIALATDTFILTWREKHVIVAEVIGHTRTARAAGPPKPWRTMR